MIPNLLLLLGSIFFLIASLGVWRLPDPLSKLHAGTKASSLGLLLMLPAAAIRFHDPGSLLLLAATLVLVFVTAPLGSHAIAKRLMTRDWKRKSGVASYDGEPRSDS
jgi:multicomponent Na+:H+ antiporter subunit G